MLAHIGTFLQDLKYAFRQLRRSPGFAAVAVCSLAIGIGANVTIYSAAHALLRSEPDAVHAEELVRVYSGDHSPLARDQYLYLARHGTTLRSLIAEDPMAVGIERGGNTERVVAAIVSENYFLDLGIHASVGSVFVGAPGDRVGAVAVLSHAFWTARFGSDSTIIGRTVRINDQSFVVRGVAREGFRSSQLGWAPSLFLPLSEQARLRGTSDNALDISSFYVTGRLAAGRTPAQAHAEIVALAPGLPRATPETAQPHAFTVERARGITAEVRTQAALVSAFLMFVVGVVLLIACANLANLLLARATARRREIAIRLALGVARGRLVRQLLTESIAVSALGGLAGVAIALYTTRLIPTLVPAEVQVTFNVSPDLNVLVFAVILTIATGLIFGLAPALHASRADVQSMLRSDGAGGGSHKSRLRSTFLVAQVSLATLLLVTAALFLKGIAAARNIDPGFRSERVADLAIDLSTRQYAEARGQLFYDEMLHRVGSLPEVEAATLIRFPPLTGSNSATGVTLPSADPNDRTASRGTTFTVVAPGYFEMLGIPIRRGRAFDATDRPTSPRVAVVNESFARMMWPTANAVGQAIRMDGALVTVVGVTPDTKYRSLNDHNDPFLYLPSTQSYSSNLVLQMRLVNDAPATRASVRKAVQELDPALPLGVVTRLDDDMRITTLPARIGAAMLSAFGILSLFLATIGVYGVTAYLVGQRIREIGIRTALGASARSVLQLMMRDTVRLVLLGLGIGIAAGMGLGVLISSWLYGVGAFDLVSIGGSALLLMCAAIAGTWLPARRALSVDPLTALRSE
jgi:putative ABC transport system permease protein